MKNKKNIIIVFMLIIIIIFSIIILLEKYDDTKYIKEKETKIENLDTDIIEYKGKKYIRNIYIKAILFMGVDNNIPMSVHQDAGYAGQADTVILIAHDEARNSIKLLNIPRDTMTNITLTDINGDIIGENIQHITMAYSFGEGSKLSSEYTKKAVSSLLFDLNIDKYITVKTKVIDIINSLVGGVKVIIPYEGLELIDENWKKGKEVLLEGSTAQKFLRYRDTKEDFSAIKRMEAQKAYILGFEKAFKEHLSKDSNLINNIFEDVEDYTYTDMNRAEEINLVKDLSTGEVLKSENIYLLPGQSNTSEWYDEYQYDKDKTLELILDMFYREK